MKPKKIKAWGLVNEYGLNWLGASQIKEVEFRPLAFETRADARAANKRLAGLKCKIRKIEIRILPTCGSGGVSGQHERTSE